VDRASISYAQHGDATPQAEISALLACYQFILDCRAKKEATRPGSPDDPERRSDAIRAHSRIP
jgi:hypothetical protein